MREAKLAYYRNKFDSSTDNPKQAWKIVNDILGRKRKDTLINELKFENKKITSPQEIATTFNNYFSNFGRNIGYSNSSNNFGRDTFKKYISNASDDASFTFRFVNESKIFQLLSSLSISKSTGHDKIPAKVLKCSASIIASSLTKLFNYAIQTGSFPFDWKIAKVIPLHKKCDRTVPDNYRLISILPIISKAFEKILYEQLHEYLSANELLSERQFGFRRFHSTATALFDCTDEWYTNLDRGLFNLVVFLDLKRAFDTVNQDILLAKLQLYRIKNESYMLLKSYSSQRSQFCHVNGKSSSTNHITCRVPQGSILGPLLFLIYINDLPNCLKRTTARLFADDTNITASGKTIKEAEEALNSDFAI